MLSIQMPFASSPLLFDCGGYQLLLPNHPLSASVILVVVALSGNCAQLDDAIAIFIQLLFFLLRMPMHTSLCPAGKIKKSVW